MAKENVPNRYAEQISQAASVIFGHALTLPFNAEANPPTGGVYLDAEQTGETERGIPQYSVTQISGMPIKLDELDRITTALVPSRGLFRPSGGAMERIQANAQKFIPDYYQKGYITQGGEMASGEVSRITSSLSGQLEEDVDWLEENAKIAKGQQRMAEVAKIEKTSADVRHHIESLVGRDHEILDTYRVGDVTATVVIPTRSIDPLFCVRMPKGRFGKADEFLNRAYELAFVSAMLGRMRPVNNQNHLKTAVALGKAAGEIALSNVLDGAKMTLGELMFLGEISYGRRIINGYPTLMPNRRHISW